MGGGGFTVRPCLRALVLLLVLTGLPFPLRSEPFARGKSEREMQVGATAWRVQAYKPDCFKDGPLLVVFHGSDRNPALARDNAVPLAQAGCALVVVPLFDEARFPRWGYQFGGLGDLVEEGGRRRFRLKPQEQRTGRLVLDLISALRAGEGVPDMSYSLIGHSAGAQFLGRFAAFFPNEARFPRWGYQFGGLGDLVEEDGKRRFRPKPREQRTGRLVLDLISALQAGEGVPDMSYSLIGHSAGAQFLGRFAAFFPNEAHRLVLANPGSYVAPTWERKYPYGFGGLTIVGEADRRRYLASPITILLGDQDLGRDGLDKSPGAERQGSTRHERGRAIYQLAGASAAGEGLAFGWSLVEVPGLGHGSRKLYARSEAALAVFGPCIGPAVLTLPACRKRTADRD